MAPLSTNTISHFTHPAHQLSHLTTNTPFLCDGCKVPGTGSRFICTICNFDLHEYCAKCPTTLTSSMSHMHPLSLAVHQNQTTLCEICHNPINGLSYQCLDCNFWVHPLCVSSDSRPHQEHKVPLSNPRHVQAPEAPSGSRSASAGQRIGESVAINVLSTTLSDVLKHALEHMDSSS